MARRYEDEDDEPQKPGLPPGFTEDQDRWGEKPGTTTGGTAPAAVEEKPAATDRLTASGDWLTSHLPLRADPEFREQIEKGAARVSGVYGQREHPEVGLLKSGYENLKRGEFQKGAHELIGAGMEFLKPTAPLMGAGGFGSTARIVGGSMLGKEIGEHIGPDVGLTKELGGDIGTIYGGYRGGKRTISRGESLPQVGRTTAATTAAEAPATLPEAATARPTARPTAGATLDAVAQRMFGMPYDELSSDQKLVAGRNAGGAPGGAERRVVRGTAPGVLERRAEEMPLPTKAPEAGVGPLTLETDNMGVRWGRVDPNLPRISIPPRLTEPADIAKYVTEKQQVQREGMATLPRAGIASPAPPAAAPAPSGTLPKTGPPPAPPPVTLGGAKPGQTPPAEKPNVPPATLDKILQQATGQKPLEPNVPLNEQLRRGQASVSEKPPPEDPLKTEFPDPAIRKFARANGAELMRAAGDRPDVVQAVHDLTNVEVREAAIRAGIDVGTKHVGSKMALGPEQIGRQSLIDQMIQQGVKPEDIPGLAKAKTEGVPYTQPMKIAPTKVRPGEGLTDEAVHHHELAHAILGGLDGFNPDAIASHRHPAVGGAAAVLYDFRQFTRGTGRLDPNLLTGGRGEAFTDMIGAGAAINELIDGIPRHLNPGLYGDIKMASRFFEALGFPRERWSELWAASIDRAKEKLTPAIQAIIKDEATRREDNLPVIFHYSSNRVRHIVERATKALYGEETPVAAQTAGVGEGHRGGAPAIAEAEGRSTPSAGGAPAPEKLKPFRTPQNTYTFVVDEQQHQLQAIDRKAAWKKLQKQFPDFTRAQMTDEVKPEIGPPVALAPKGSTTPLFKKPADVGEKPTVADFVESMRQRNKQAGLKPVIAADHPEVALGRALKIGEAELDFQRMRPNSGEEWYNQDAKRYDDALKLYHDAMKDPAKLTIAKAIQAGMSLGNKSIPAITNTLDAIDAWQKTGRIPLKNPATGGAWPNGQYNVYMHGFRRLQLLINQKGEAGAGQWLMEQHPVSELRKYSPGVKGKADDMQYGALALGPKFGPFFLNNMGIGEALTTDMWWARTWNRWMGTPFQEIMKDGKRTQKVVEQVRPGERPIMEDFAATLAKKKGLEVKQVQAILWNYEQALYKLHGFQNAEQPSYGQAAETLVRERIQQRNAQGGAGAARARQDAGTRRSAERVRRSP